MKNILVFFIFYSYVALGQDLVELSYGVDQCAVLAPNEILKLNHQGFTNTIQKTKTSCLLNNINECKSLKIFQENIQCENPGEIRFFAFDGGELELKNGKYLPRSKDLCTNLKTSKVFLSGHVQFSPFGCDLQLSVYKNSCLVTSKHLVEDEKEGKICQKIYLEKSGIVCTGSEDQVWPRPFIGCPGEIKDLKDKALWIKSAKARIRKKEQATYYKLLE